jgi:hypothetical protein
MVERKSWEEFRAIGLLWWINAILHTFGWAIVVSVEDGIITEAYPARVKFRGFDERTNSEGYLKVSQYLSENHQQLLEEAKE